MLYIFYAIYTTDKEKIRVSQSPNLPYWRKEKMQHEEKTWYQGGQKPVTPMAELQNGSSFKEMWKAGNLPDHYRGIPDKRVSG